MTFAGHSFKLSLVALCAALVLVAAYVEFRAANPGWKHYQQRGLALSIERLEMDLDRVASPEKRTDILNELALLRKRKPEIIEIRPFGGKLGPERCLTCHFGIEDLSESHPNSVFGCVICHGGNGADLTARGAHLGLRGGRNPARLDLAGVSCGSSGPLVGQCHSGRESHLLDRVENVPRSLMATNAGIIGILRFQWGLTKDSTSAFGIRSVSDGTKSLRAVPEERTSDGKVSLADSHFRKFCAACHLWVSSSDKNMGRLEGCPACHAPYSPDGRYSGSDPTIKRTEAGHPTTHTITNRIPDTRCRACHNRSARVGLNYHGEMETEQYGTPFVRGSLNDYTLSEDRFVFKLVPDIHHEKGLGCIDCHTGQDTMGDGTVHAHMQDQIEIRCEDCHGSYSAPPRTIKVAKEDPIVQTLIRTSAFVKIADGDEIAVTSRGRPLPHVRKAGGEFRLTSKLTGKDHQVTVITGKNRAHGIKGHERLECDSCHSAWSPQCFGCHQVLDFGHKGLDHVAQEMTPGRWAEGRGYFRFFKNILGLNARGKIGILVPGCLVWNTVVDSTGRVVPPYDSKVMALQNGLTSIASAPTHPHTSRVEAPRCVDCHYDSKALGLGEGRLTRDGETGRLRVEPIYDSRNAGLKIDFPLDALVSAGRGTLQGTSHSLSRPFNSEELRRIVGIVPCLPCHDRYDDPVWQRSGPYDLTPECRRALGNVTEKRKGGSGESRGPRTR